jgi:PHP family Zn ribbon phosphoesterase
MIITADLHLHSCVSPCGDLFMSPRVIVETLEAKHIQLAALTDHNTSLNTPAFSLCCHEHHIAALYGMEAQTAEELHCLTLFSNVELALNFCKSWYDLLPNVINKPDKTGDQVYVDEHDDILGEVEKYLITSASVSLDELEKQVHTYGGLVIPAHVDRPSFSMTSQLGCVVDGNWDALEFVKPSVAPKLLPSPYPVTTSSDAHYVEHIGRRAFKLDIGDLPLLNADGTVNLETVRAGLAKLVVCPDDAASVSNRAG